VVSDALAKTNTTLIPVIAVQTSASSGAHLTKYSNITDPVVGQKKLIVDDALIPT
jgi:alcohol dehydrogenase